MWKQAVLIPACREQQNLPTCISSLAEQANDTLLVLVLNARQDATPSVHLENQACAQWLKTFPHREITEDITEIQYPNLTIHLIDRFTSQNRLLPKEGVGKARAIAAQYICDLYNKKLVLSPWIRSCDADARFPSDYLHPIPYEKGTALLPYIHVGPTGEGLPSTSLQVYEIYLRYYTLGLHYAGSPFAYPTIASTIIMHAETYQKSHGFPNRMAGEDFYLLAKAAKIAPIYYLKRDALKLIDRPSVRVPFGTAQASQQIKTAGNHKPFYHPKIFSVLKEWINVLNTASDHDLHAQLSKIAPEYPPLKKLNNLLRQKATGQRLIQRRHEWFDAFRTLKWIHHMRDHTWGTVSCAQACTTAVFLGLSQDAPLEQWLEEIKVLEEECITVSGLHDSFFATRLKNVDE